jgi:hypothetical protein
VLAEALSMDLILKTDWWSKVNVAALCGAVGLLAAIVVGLF